MTAIVPVIYVTAVTNQTLLRGRTYTFASFGSGGFLVVNDMSIKKNPPLFRNYSKLICFTNIEHSIYIQFHERILNTTLKNQVAAYKMLSLIFYCVPEKNQSQIYFYFK